MSLEKLSSDLADRYGLKPSVVYVLMREAMRQIEIAVVRDGRFQVRGFGVWKFRRTAARVGRNVGTGELIAVPEGRKIEFRHESVRLALIQRLAAEGVESTAGEFFEGGLDAGPPANT